jgi:hypothetical protein
VKSRLDLEAAAERNTCMYVCVCRLLASLSLGQILPLLIITTCWLSCDILAAMMSVDDDTNDVDANGSLWVELKQT